MIWIVTIVGGLAGLVALMALVGLTLRPDHLAARTGLVPRPPGELYALLRDVERAPTWRADVKRVELLPALDGKRSFREHGRQGVLTYVVDVDQPPVGDQPGRLVIRIADDKLPFGGQWVIDVAAEGAGSRVTVTEDGFVKNPVFRFLSRTVFSLTSTIEGWLRALGRHFGAELTPSPADPVKLLRRSEVAPS